MSRITANWTRENLAWAAGLFEGEGSIGRHNLKRGGRPQWRMTMASTDEDVLRRFHEIVGVGHISGPYCHKNPKHKPYWQWCNIRRAWVFALLVAFWPWLCMRRREKAAQAIQELPPVSEKVRCV